jgi:NAD(P)H-dependent FMN reductase
VSKLKIAVIISSTRPTRFGDKPAQWIKDLANQREEIEADILDLRDFDLPFFNEAASNLWAPSQDPQAIAWQNKISRISTATSSSSAEYNRSITGALKNALRPSL